MRISKNPSVSTVLQSSSIEGSAVSNATKATKKEKKVEAPVDLFKEYRDKWQAISPGWFAILSAQPEKFMTALNGNPTAVVAENNSVSSILGLALSYQNYEATTALLKAGADKDFKNALGKKSIHMAAENLETPEQYAFMRQYLLDNGFNLEDSYTLEKTVHTFDSLAAQSLKVERPKWKRDYDPMFEAKPQWLIDKEKQKEKQELGETSKEEATATRIVSALKTSKKMKK